MIDKDRGAGDEAGLILTRESRDALLIECPALAPFVREIYGGEEFLNGTVRWCLWSWLRRRMSCGSPASARPHGIRPAFPKQRPTTDLETGDDPDGCSGEIRQPASRYLLIPKVSSNPAGISRSASLTEDHRQRQRLDRSVAASHYDFGILSSAMHNAWMRTWRAG